MGLKSVETLDHSMGVILTMRSSSIVHDAKWEVAASCMYDIDGFSLLKFTRMVTIL